MARQEAALAREQARLEMLRTQLAEQTAREALTPAQHAYQAMAARLQKLCARHIPRRAAALVVTRGDAKLLKFSTQAAHFPHAADGGYAGNDPRAELPALVQLAANRAAGAEFFVLPQTFHWWAGHYPALFRHLNNHCRVVADVADTGKIWSLIRPPKAGAKNLAAQFAAIAAEFRTAAEREPVVLDWFSGPHWEGLLPDCAVFKPHGHGALPYLNGTADFVITASSDAVALGEAHRVARAAVLRLDHAAQKLSVEWKPGFSGTGFQPVSFCPKPEPSLILQDSGTKSETHRLEACATAARVAIVMPCYHGEAMTAACLRSLFETLPKNVGCEVIVVDDCSKDGTAAMLKNFSRREPRLKIFRHKKNLGFVDSCNHGAASATGEILIFLNNDLVLLPGWLEPLLQTFRDRADAGVVGGKLIFPDGTFQEAGGVVFRDGSAMNYGRADTDLTAPQFSFLREVDYCSGALFATRRATFQKLGGFDAEFRPGYYEDTDYCFRVRAAGLKVYFQPESAVIHREGGTAGTDTARGMKRYQVINQKKFLARHAEALKLQPPHPGWSNHAALKSLAWRNPKRVLVAAYNPPEFDRDSGSKRILDLIELLLEDGWSVTFLAQKWTPSPRYTRLLQQLGVAVFDGRLTKAEELFAMLKFDVALLAFWPVAETYLPALRKVSPPTRIIVDSVDLHFLRVARGIFKKAADKKNVGALAGGYGSDTMRELNAYAAADAVLTVSRKEALLVDDFISQPGLAHAVADLERTADAPLPLAERRGIVFMGSFRHVPNIGAVEFLCKEVLPQLNPALTARHPIYILGEGMTDEIRALADGLPQVQMVGWVPSVLPYLERARLSVIPLRFGAGTKRKLLQTIVAGTPAVSTTCGIEGFGLVDGEHVLVADEGKFFAAAIAKLLTDDLLWQKLSTQGREHLLATHGRDAVRRQLQAAIAAAKIAPLKITLKQPVAITSAAPVRVDKQQYGEIIKDIRRFVEQHLPANAADGARRSRRFNFRAGGRPKNSSPPSDRTLKRAEARAPLPQVIVVSKGDNELLKLNGCAGQHFPQDSKGGYAGYHPENGADAVKLLEAARKRGGEFLLLPSTSLWWLDHYKELAAHLATHYAEAARDEATCVLFDLRVKRPAMPAKKIIRELSDVRLIAFYLPQFHPIPENDAWWGEGFTEWTNVGRAQPAFAGHQQPQIPGDLGFYDLRLAETRAAQAALARAHGVHGFCYYHYWFGGQRLLERPFNEVLASGEPDFPFCLCWANEPWSRRWDGQAENVLQAQTYSPEDDVNHIRWLIPALADERAIRIAGKPVFVVYQGRDLPDPARTVATWRREVAAAGLPGIYLLTVETGWDEGWDATQVGFDGKILFAPQFTTLGNSGAEIKIPGQEKLRVFDYQQAWPVLANPKPVDYLRYETVCPAWDNSARRGDAAWVLHNATPAAYEQWLRAAVGRAAARPANQRVVFLNAWNEWAEGAHLEPDLKNGLAYLEATKRGRHIERVAKRLKAKIK